MSSTLQITLIFIGAGLLEYITNLLFNFKIIFVSKSEFERAAIYGATATFLGITLSTTLSFVSISEGTGGLIIVGAAVIALGNFLGTITVAYFNNKKRFKETFKDRYYSFKLNKDSTGTPNYESKIVSISGKKSRKSKNMNSADFLGIAAIRQYELYRSKGARKEDKKETAPKNEKLAKLDGANMNVGVDKVKNMNRVDMKSRDSIVTYQAIKLRKSINSKEDKEIRDMRNLYRNK